VADAVDHTGGEERDPQHLHRPHGESDRAEQGEVDPQHEADAEPGVLRVQLALDPVIGCAVAVFLERCGVCAFYPIELGTLEQDFPDSVNLRAVRVLRGVGCSVVLAVDCRPLPGDHPGG
jgi:hypothetical protein